MSLAIMDKKPQQHNGGCVSLFLQIFSKKKFFFKKAKLLPPAKKINNDNKMLMFKPLLIADENKGVLPKVEFNGGPDPENKMQAPGIVARLMGLESIPVVDKEKPRKSLDSKFRNNFSFEHSRIDEELCMDSSRNAMVLLRPQKVQKTRGSFLEKRPVGNFSRNLIYGSMKNKYMKLETPVKSPRLSSRSSTSRLVQVANKILEPGLRSSSRAMHAITLVGSLEDGERGNEAQFSSFVDESCVSCGSSIAECGSSASDLSSNSEENKNIKSLVFPNAEKKNDTVNFQSMLKAGEMHKKEEKSVQAKLTKNGFLRGQGKLNVGSYWCEKPVLRNSNLRQTQSSPVRNIVVAEKQTAKNLLSRSKNFVELNKNVNSYTRSKSPTKVSGDSRYECRDGSVKNIAQKRASSKKNPVAFNSSTVRDRSVRSGVASIERKRLNSTESITGRSSSKKLDCESLSGSKSNGDIISFTFSSPIRCDTKIGNSSSQKGMALRGDELSNLLEDKIRQLSALERGELTSVDGLQERSTVSILEELISALTLGGAHESDMNDDCCSNVSIQTEILPNNQKINIDAEFQEKGDQPSPVSILEASFSNDSCSMESLNAILGNKPRLGLPEMCNDTQPSNIDPDLLDSATSLDITQSSIEITNNNKFGVSETDLCTTTEIISDTELLFENLSLNSSNKNLDSFLIEIIEDIIDAREGDQTHELLYDFLTESLNSKYSHFCRSGFKAWLKLPLMLNRDLIVREVNVEIIELNNLAGKQLDYLVAKEMKGSELEWTKCKTEAFEMGMEIQGDILQTLINELMVDMC